MASKPSPENSAAIVRYGHPALRKPAARVGRVNADIKQLVARMVESMRAAHGLGLAATQVGDNRRVAVIEVDGDLTVIVNPELTACRGRDIGEEGCLSFPRLYGCVERPTHVSVKARNLSGKTVTIEGEGMLARALCHEIDHLDGKLFIDVVDPTTLYWLLGHDEEGEPITQPTTLENALRAFGAARDARG